MLDHLETTGGGHEGGAGGDVDGVGAIATGARGVQDTRARDRERAASVEEGLGGTGDIGEGFATGADGGQQGRDVDIVVFTDGHRGEHLHRLLDGGVGVVQVLNQYGQGCIRGHMGKILHLTSC